MTELKTKDKINTEDTMQEIASQEVQDIIDLAEKAKEGDSKAIVTMMSAFRGPLPPPELLQQYEDIKEGLADRIVAMAEKDQEAYIEDRKTMLKYQGRDSLLGALFAFIIVIATLAIGCLLLLNDKDIAGIGVLLTGLGSVIAMFLKSKKENKKDDE